MPENAQIELLEGTLAQVRIDRDAWRDRAIGAQFFIRVMGIALAVAIVVGIVALITLLQLNGAVQDQNAVLNRQGQSTGYQVARGDYSDCIGGYDADAKVKAIKAQGSFEHAFDPALALSETVAAIDQARVDNDAAVAAAQKYQDSRDPAKGVCVPPDKPKFLSK